MQPPTPPDAFEQVMDETRQRFSASFPSQCDSLRILIDRIAQYGPNGPVPALAQSAHTLSGLAGTIGFPAISARASELEDLVAIAGERTFDAVRAGDLVDAMQAAFNAELARAVAPPATPDAIAPARGETILVAEDDAGQRAVVTAYLERAGFAPVAVATGDLVVGLARAEKPGLILLDIAMPGLDGYTVCRRLKADPELAGIPVIFMTTDANVEDRRAGLALGADDFLHKPIDMRDLVLRIDLLIKGTRPRAPVAAAEVAGTVTVVVAEDDPDVTRILDAQLRAAGYTSILAADGEAALAAVRDHTVQVMLLDLMMPKIDGFAVLGQLRKASLLWPRIIVLSARGREQDVERAFQLGADDYVTKPFNPQEMMARIARMLK